MRIANSPTTPRHAFRRAGFVLTLGLLFALLFTSCTDDGDEEDSTDAPNLAPAWTAYGAGDWAEANAFFLSAVQSAPSSAEAWCGLGWSRAAVQAASDGAIDLNEGVRDAFRRADQLRADYVEVWAGLAEFHSAQGDTMAALNWALDAADTGGASWHFHHNPAVNHRSLRKIAAWQLFKLKRYAEAGAQVRLVLPTFVYATGSDSLTILLEGIGSL